MSEIPDQPVEQTEPILGAKVIALRPMTFAELIEEGWEGEVAPMCLIFDNGAVLYASRDEEGNGPGALFGQQVDPKTGEIIQFQY